jgi:predicted dehydrogenase
VGIYSLTWVFQTLYHTLPVAQRKAPEVSSFISKYPKTGADEMTSILLSFPSGPGGASYAHGIATTALRVATNESSSAAAKPAIRIQGSKGEIQVDSPAYRPEAWRIIRKGSDGKESVEEHKNEMPGGGRGFMYEADEVARCIRDGKLESDTLSWDESVVIMHVMDEVRQQGGLNYPEKLETLDYPIDHW